MKNLVPPIDMFCIGSLISECTISKGLVLCPLLVKKRSPMLFAFDMRFVKQQGCGAEFFAKVHITHHVLKRMNILHIQMAKAMMSKLEHAISRWMLH